MGAATPERPNEEQIFDLAADPRELRDLSGNVSLLDPFRRRLAEHLARHGENTFDSAGLCPCANRPPRALWEGRAPL